jgi:hypothetical protein
MEKKGNQRDVHHGDVDFVKGTMRREKMRQARRHDLETTLPFSRP